MKKTHYYAFLMLLGLFSESCRRRTDLEVAAGVKSPAEMEQDISSLRREREALLAELQTQQMEAATKVSDLTLERDELMSSKSSFEAEIKKAKEELSLKQDASEAEKIQIRTKLEGAQKNLDGVQQKLKGNETRLAEQLAKIKSLNEDMKKLSDRISDLTAKIDQLTQQLNAERQKNEQLIRQQGDRVAASLPASIPSDTAPMEIPSTSSVGSSNSTVKGSVSTKAWQFLVEQGGSQLCFEFGSTTANASLLALACVNPAPVRQLFKMESLGSQGILLLDQRTSPTMCARIDPKVTTRVVLQTCQRNGLQDELWDLVEADTSTGRFKIKNRKSGLCLSVSPEKRVIQQDCATALEISSL